MKHKLWEVFKDNWDPKVPWRIQFPAGVMPYRTKREALADATKLRDSWKGLYPPGLTDSASSVDLTNY